MKNSKGERVMKKSITALVSISMFCVLQTPTSFAATSVTVSKTKEIAYEGERVQLKFTNFPSKAGIYVFQCVVPANGGLLPDLRQCNSADQLWITSSGRGSFLPSSPEISIRVIGKFGNFDCATEKCALFFQFDRFAADDRSQDQMIPLSFKSPSASQPVQPLASPSPLPATQSIGSIRNSIRVGQNLSLPATTDKGVAVLYRLKTPKICSLAGARIEAKRKGTCLIDAYAAPSQSFEMFTAELGIRILARKR